MLRNNCVIVVVVVVVVVVVGHLKRPQTDRTAHLRQDATNTRRTSGPWRVYMHAKSCIFRSRGLSDNTVAYIHLVGIELPYDTCDKSA